MLGRRLDLIPVSGVPAACIYLRHSGAAEETCGLRFRCCVGALHAERGAPRDVFLRSHVAKRLIVEETYGKVMKSA